MWPNETQTYRAARDELLAAEAALRKQAEAVAERRRNLPPGGEIKEDYVFQNARDGSEVKLSQLFEPGKDVLCLYSFMYSPGADSPCPMCTSLIDSLAGQTGQYAQRMNFAVVAKATPEELRQFADSRDWNGLRLVSSNGTTYNADYRSETPDGAQLPIMHVWQRGEDGTIRLFWASELFFHDDPDWSAHPRHMDHVWPLWSMFDLTPIGRGENWYPSLA